MPEQAYSSRRAGESGHRGPDATSPDRHVERTSTKKHAPTPIAPTVADVMNRDIEFCVPECSVQAVARMMAERNVGSIPIVDNADHMVPIGIITDRDIVTRVIAPALDPTSVRIDQCMSLEVRTVASNAPVSDAVSLMQRHDLRRLPVIDDTGCLVGIISQADMTRPANPQEDAEMIREISEPVS